MMGLSSWRAHGLLALPAGAAIAFASVRFPQYPDVDAVTGVVLVASVGLIAIGLAIAARVDATPSEGPA